MEALRDPRVDTLEAPNDQKPTTEAKQADLTLTPSSDSEL
jgi:hypothetical protein